MVKYIIGDPKENKMVRTITVAAVQMDANPGTVPDRLAKAAVLVSAAARDGAQLVVLPELFNTGYGYYNTNHQLAEHLDGMTSSWMQKTSARLGIHLAGSLLLLDGDEVYNAMLLYAPDGRVWRYDKNYPWAWERGYFRDSHRIGVAETELGDIGMMVCWDAAHASLWKKYAGRQDLMIICGSPLNVSNGAFLFEDGDRVMFKKMGILRYFLPGTEKRLFDKMISQQTAWLKVPVIHTTGSGIITTWVPNGRKTLLIILPFAPRLAKYLSQAKRMILTAPMFERTRILDQAGEPLSTIPSGEDGAYIVNQVELPLRKKLPKERQPRTSLNPLVYLISDALLPWVSLPVYRSGLRKVWGRQMAPVQPATRRWTVIAGGVAVISVAMGLLVGLLLGRKKKKGQ
jgi:hypothetical protein